MFALFVAPNVFYISTMFPTILPSPVRYLAKCKKMNTEDFEKLRGEVRVVALDKRQMGEMVFVSARQRQFLYQVGGGLQLSVNQFYKKNTNHCISKEWIFWNKTERINYRYSIFNDD